jgi:hypothetical protein
MFLQLLIGTFMIGTTVIMHALALDFIIRNTRSIETTIMHARYRRWKPFVIATIVLAIFFAHVVEIWVWAAVYFALSAFPHFETALYFSTTAFTTVGFGDMMPTQNWRLLGAVEGANGFMLFGWSTAFTFEILSQLYRREGEALNKGN